MGAPVIEREINFVDGFFESGFLPDAMILNSKAHASKKIIKNPKKAIFPKVPQSSRHSLFHPERQMN